MRVRNCIILTGLPKLAFVDQQILFLQWNNKRKLAPAFLLALRNLYDENNKV